MASTSDEISPAALRPIRPAYGKVLLTFVRNSLVRDMSFRTNFALQCVTSLSWALMNFGLYKIIYSHTRQIGEWGEHEFFVFLATMWIINSIVQTLFMPNAEEFSELIRTGHLDYALLKPIDTQFLISFTRIDWAQLTNLFAGLAILGLSLVQLVQQPLNPLTIEPWTVVAYLFFIACGTVVMYGLMFSLAATSIWLGRNQNLYTFWFYITNFYRYPMEIYQRGVLGWSLFATFTFVIPILVVVNVPARLLARPLRPDWHAYEWAFAALAVIAAFASLATSRFVFRWALSSYRSASS
jgi:ABC-2 type transport system permease protein